MEKIILIGFGGHAKVVTDTIESSGIYRIAGYIEKRDLPEKSFRDYRVIGSDCQLKKIYESGIRNAFISIGFLGNCDIRKQLYENLKLIGFTLPPIVDGSAVIAKDAVIGEGTYVGKNAVINASAIVDKMCIINTAAVVEHDSVIGGFSHLAVGSAACGNVSIGKNVFIGANATIIQGIHVGDNVTVGAGAVVLEDVPCNQTIYGVWK